MLCHTPIPARFQPDMSQVYGTISWYGYIANAHAWLYAIYPVLCQAVLLYVIIILRPRQIAMWHVPSVWNNFLMCLLYKCTCLTTYNKCHAICHAGNVISYPIIPRQIAMWHVQVNGTISWYGYTTNTYAWALTVYNNCPAVPSCVMSYPYTQTDRNLTCPTCMEQFPDMDTLQTHMLDRIQ